MAIKIADDFAGALERAGLRATFDSMPPSHQREYADWIAEAKKETTRLGRVRRSIEMVRDWAQARGKKPRAQTKKPRAQTKKPRR